MADRTNPLPVVKAGMRELTERRRAMAEGRLGGGILVSIEAIKNPPPGGPDVRALRQALGIPKVGQEAAGPPPVEKAIDAQIAQYGALIDVPDDKLPCMSWIERYGQALPCALLGKPIRYFSVGQTTSSEVRTREASLDALMDFEFDKDSPLLNEILAGAARGQAHGAGRCYMSTFLCRGGMAVMTQFLGYERAFLELCDRPDEAHAFFRKVMEMEICFTERQFEAIGPVEGGWVCERFDWCPAQCIGFNLDDFILCANEMFLEFGLPYYQAMADRFGYGVLHYHTPDMRLMKAAARMKNVAVQVGVDPKLPLPWQRLDEIKAACGDMPITWMRIPRDEFLRRLKEGRLPGNVEYCISDAIDLDDARRLAEMGRSYQAR